MRDETYEEYEEYEDEYDDDDEEVEIEVETEDLEEDARVGLIARAINHPRISLGGSTLLATGIFDIATHLNPLAVFLGAVLTIGAAVEGPNVAKGLQEMFIPGSDTERQRENATQVANRIAPNSVEYVDQSLGAKIRRLVVGDKNDAVVEDDAEEQEEYTSPLRKRAVKKLPPMRTQTQCTNAEGLTHERITDLYLRGQINDTQYTALLNRIDHPQSGSGYGNGNDATDEHEAASEAVGSPQNASFRPPGWDEEKEQQLIGAYLACGAQSKSIEAIGLSDSQRNRDYAREVLKRNGFLKGK